MHTNKVFGMDAVTFLADMEDESVDLLIFDPAYESLEKHRKVGTTTRLKESKSSSNKWFEIFRNERFEELFTQLYRVLKKNGHCYMMSDMETMWVVRPIAEAAGFRYWKDIIWNKLAIGMGYHYRAQTERVLFFEKGKRKLLNLSIPDWLEEKDFCGPDSIYVKRLRAKDLYPTEKPMELCEVLVLMSSQPGDLVVDMFCGSGSCGEAAIKNGRFFWGNDLSEDALEVTEERIDAAIAAQPDTTSHVLKYEWEEHVPGMTACGINFHDGKRTKNTSISTEPTCPYCIVEKAKY